MPLPSPPPPPPLILLLRQFMLHHRLRFFHNYHQRLAVAGPYRPWCSAAAGETNPPSSTEHANDDREWKDKEKQILRDIGPVVMLTKDILHSPRYMDGELLTVEDEKVVVEKLLPYHPDYEDKIGCGIESIMVDHHPEFRRSRCLFVVRTDGSWIDFSYHECLRKYIRDKYPTHAERFIGEHFIRRKMRIEWNLIT